jgi:lipoyl(octanoyl) transferase
MVNTRQTIDLTRIATDFGGSEVDWLTSDAPVGYLEAVAAMESRAAAIADGRARDQV